MAEIGHFIAGEHLFDAGAPSQGVFNPATGEQTSRVTLGGKPEVDKAVAVGLAAWPEWAEMPVLRRARILDQFKSIMTGRTDQLASAITAEHGKTLEDAAGEIIRGLEVVEFALGAPHFSKGEYSENIGSGVDSFSMRQPLGVVAGITPFNFPAMVPMWMFPSLLSTTIMYFHG